VFTLATLMQHQTDIRDCGYVLSYALILLMNMIGIGLWIVAVSQVTIEDFLAAGQVSVEQVGEWLAQAARGVTALVDAKRAGRMQ
jgi:hypothetical protein